MRSRSSRLERDPAVLWRRYRRRFFKRDVIANAPYELLLPAVAALLGGDWLAALALCRVPKLLRLVRVPHLLERLDRAVVRLPFRVDHGLLQLAQIICVHFFVVHIFACSWLAVARYLEARTDRTWLTVDATLRVPGLLLEGPGALYLRALHFAVQTATSCGYGDIRPQNDLETLHEVVLVFVSTCTMAAVIGVFAVRFGIWDSTGTGCAAHRACRCASCNTRAPCWQGTFAAHACAASVLRPAARRDRAPRRRAQPLPRGVGEVRALSAVARWRPRSGCCVAASATKTIRTWTPAAPAGRCCWRRARPPSWPRRLTCPCRVGCGKMWPCA